MLRELKVENLALIKDLSLSFEPGFNVLTGETGAGKSLLVDAVGLAIGARASTELVRQGAGEAVVEALFEPAGPAARQALDLALVERGLPTAKGVMIVRRLIGSGGRHRVYVNGSLATVATLAEIARGLVAVCGQHEHVSLTRPGEALALLDDYASATDPDFSQLRAAYAAAWHELQAARSGLSAFQEDPAARAERESFVRFQISELESLAPSPGEIEELEAEQRRLSSATRLQAIT
ncbi:MAG: AAA family ATPase, partial [Myxococcota bacterium]